MSRTGYYKIPLGRKRRVKRCLVAQFGLSFSTLGKKEFYRGENILVSIDRRLATVIYDSLFFSENLVSGLFAK